MNESKATWYIVIDYMDRTTGRVGPFTARMFAEQAMANSIARENVASAHLEEETHVRVNAA